MISLKSLSEIVKPGDIVAKNDGFGYKCEDGYRDEEELEYEVLMVWDNAVLIKRARGREATNWVNYFEYMYNIPKPDVEKIKKEYKDIRISSIFGDMFFENWHVVKHNEQVKPITQANLTEQMVRDRAFFFRDLEKPYSPPVREDGERVSGLRYL